MLPEYEPPVPERSRERTLDIAVPVSVALVLVIASFVFRAPCVAKLGDLEYSERHLCYTDIYALYGVEGLSKGSVPYFDTRPDGKYVEYPVLTGVWMLVTSRMTHVFVGEADRGTVRGYNTYFWLNQVGFGMLILIAAGVLGALVGRRRALLFAAAPTLVLHGGVSWDMLAVTPFVLALWAFSRERHALSGVMLGIGAAAKLYPIFAVPYLGIQLVRFGKTRRAITLFATSVGTLVLVNLPFALGAREGWLRFFRLNQERGADWDSIWYHVSQTWRVTFQTPRLNLITAVLFVAGALALGVWQWFRLARDQEFAFDGMRRTTATALLLVVLWFLIVNKVWSPQYGIWLLPFWTFAVPLAGAWLVGTWAIFQGLEIFVFATRFWMFARKVTYEAFRTAIFARLAMLMVFMSWLLWRRPARAAPAAADHE